MKSGKRVIGWREWVGLPDLGIPHIKAKVDTGARTSTLHAFSIDPFCESGIEMIRFRIHPFQRQTGLVVECLAEVHDRRWVCDSGGHSDLRYVIQTRLAMAGGFHSIELTLTDRDTMLFRMLLGRTAIRGRYVVDPQTSYRLGKDAK